MATAAYESASGLKYLDIYILENGEGHAGGMCGGRSWCTGFEYTGILPMELGVLCIEDDEANWQSAMRRTAASFLTRRTSASS